MAEGVDIDLWVQSRRLGETQAQIAVLGDVWMLLIEIADVAAADAMATRLDRLRKHLDYRNHAMVAMQARAAVRHAGTFKRQCLARARSTARYDVRI